MLVQIYGISKRSLLLAMDIEERRSKPRWLLNLGDFANMVKAFVGSSYLNTAYGFKQSGVGLGIIGIAVMAFLTDHCCHLIVKTKHHVIDKMLQNRVSGRSSKHRNYETLNNRQKEAIVEPRTNDFENIQTNDTTPLVQSNSASHTRTDNNAHENDENDKDTKEYMLKNMTYGDIGKLAYGHLGVGIVNFSIGFTQFGFCVGYFILIGNTIHSLFPERLCNTINETSNCHSFKRTGENNINLVGVMTKSPASINNMSTGLDNFGTTLIPTLETIAVNVTPTHLTNTTAVEMIRTIVSDAPDLRTLVVAPLPVFIFLVFIRSVRYLGIISVIANTSMLIGILAVIGFLLSEFSVHASTSWFNWETFPVFFGMVTGAFEGISLVIPIESSMEGNRELFPCFLHGAILCLTAVLGSFGLLGYLKYGSSVKQMLNTNIPSGSLSMAVNICICLGVLLTFPLQMFPVTEILEKYLFTKGKVCGPKENISSTERMHETDSRPQGDDIATHIPGSIAAWKRNILRIIVVLLIAGIAVLMKDNFAYVYAFVGALGSSLLVYVLPCLFHLKICWNDVSPIFKIKDIALVIFGVAGAVIGVYSVIRNTKL